MSNDSRSVGPGEQDVDLQRDLVEIGLASFAGLSITCYQFLASGNLERQFFVSFGQFLDQLEPVFNLRQFLPETQSCA